MIEREQQGMNAKQQAKQQATHFTVVIKLSRSRQLLSVVAVIMGDILDTVHVTFP